MSRTLNACAHHAHDRARTNQAQRWTLAAGSKDVGTHWRRGCKGRRSVGCVSWEAGGCAAHDDLCVPVYVLYEAALARLACVHRVLHIGNDIFMVRLAPGTNSKEQHTCSQTWRELWWMP